MNPSHSLVTALPCSDLDKSEAFYRRLGFYRLVREPRPWDDEYRILEDGKGGHIHLTKAVEGWLVPGRNPFGVYFYTDEVDRLAAEFKGQIVGQGPADTPWGMYEFSLSDPDETLVRIGRPSQSK